MYLLILFSTTFTVLAVSWYLKRRRDHQILVKCNIPGPKPSLFTGNVSDLETDNAKQLGRWLDEYGSTCGYYFGNKPFITTKNPDLMRRIFIKEYHTFSNRPKVVDFDPSDKMFDSLIFLDDDRWKRIRTLMRPSFSALKLRKTLPQIEDSSDRLIKLIDEKIDTNGDESIEVYEFYRRLTMEVIGRVAFGVETNSQTDANDPFIKAGKRSTVDARMNIFFKIVVAFPEIIRVLMPILSRFRFKGGFNGLYEIAERVYDDRQSRSIQHHDIIQTMMDARIGEKALNAADSELTMHSKSAESEISDTKIEKDENVIRLSKSEIVSNTAFLLGAGYETTSTCLAFTSYLIARHPDVQARIRQEVRDHIEAGGKLDYSVVEGLPYLSAVVNESLRIYPPITMVILRTPRNDYKFDDMIIPKGSAFIAAIYYLHHSDEFWSEPERFNPERFYDPDLAKEINPMAYLPFGLGPKNCLGMRLALFEINLSLAKILLKFNLALGKEFDQNEELEVDFKFVNMMPRNGIHLKVTRIAG